MKSKAFYKGVKCAEDNPKWVLEDFLDHNPYPSNTKTFEDFIAGAYGQRNLNEIENLRADTSQLSLEEAYEVYDANEEIEDED